MADDDTIILVCAPYVEGDIPRDPTSKRGEWCMECADELWMSAIMKQFWDENPKALVICAPCAVEHEDFVPEPLPGDHVGEVLAEMGVPIMPIVRALYQRDPPQP